MKTQRTILCICILAVGISGLLSGQTLSGNQKAEIARQVDAVFLNMVKAAENLDYDKISKGVDDRHNAGFIVNNSYFPKYSAMIDILMANRPGGAKQSISIRDKKITVLTDKIVLQTASGTASVELETGQSFKVNFLWSFVYEKINNEWKVIQSHQSQAN